jgi:hypothetical protein
LRDSIVELQKLNAQNDVVEDEEDDEFIDEEPDD